MPTANCPECKEKVFVEAEAEQGDIVVCEECDSDLEVVGLDPIELDLYDGSREDRDDFDSYDYDNDDRY